MEEIQKTEYNENNRLFTDRIRKIWYYGGMMRINRRYYARVPLTLLEPVTQAEKGTGSFHYNYFEDAYWEEDVCDPTETVLYRKKDGGRVFSNVLHAAMSLFDIMKPEEGIQLLNKDTANARRAIGWINHLFHEEYALEDGKTIPPMKTADFLRLDDDIAYLFNPEALRGKRDYTMTDADRLYWWRKGSEEVTINEDLNQWLIGLAARHKECMQEMRSYEEYEFRGLFAVQLYRLDEYYRRVYTFRSMFRDFMLHGNELPYQAAMELLKKLDTECRQEGSVMQLASPDWDANSCNITRNPGRMKIRRYLAVMANKELRKRFFDF